MNGTGSILTSCILYNGLQAAKKLFLKGQCWAKSVSRDPYAFFFSTFEKEQ